MKLRVLLSAPSPGWSLFLDQEKVSYQTALPGAPYPGREETPVLILSGASPSDGKLAQTHLEAGGSVIADSKSRYALPPSGGSQSQIFILPDSVEESAGNWASAEKQFHFGATMITEITAVERKSETRLRIRAALQNAFWRQSLPYAHLGYYPAPFRGVFSFRFDLDEYDKKDHAVFCGLLEKYRGAVSCFVCTKTFEPLDKELARVCATGVEVGSHGYVHHVYSDETQNRINFDHAERILIKQGQKIGGFSAPHGTWHPTLQKQLEDRNYLYSSEFSLDYDNFPFFPLLNGRASSVLQIPTHPVCEGVFMERYSYQEEMLKNYFNAVIEDKISKEEPVLFFGHPDRRIGRHPEILENIFKTIERYPDIWKTEFSQFALWWKKRHAVSWDGEYVGSTVKLRACGGDSAQVQVELVFENGKREFYSLSNPQTAPRSAAPIPEKPSPVTETPAVHGSFKKLKRGLKKWLDWETKTPVSMLKVTGTRTLAKKFLRQAAGKP